MRVSTHLVFEHSQKSKEFYRDHTKIQGFWTKKIFLKKKKIEIFLIFFSHQEWNSFSPEFYRDHTKIQGFWKKVMN